MKLWIDDSRIPVTDEYVWAKTSQDARHLFYKGEIETVVFDNDLGLHSHEDGNKVLHYMLKEIEYYPKSIVIITSNPVERVNMQRMVEDTGKYGDALYVTVRPHFREVERLYAKYDPHRSFYIGDWSAVMYERKGFSLYAEI